MLDIIEEFVTNLGLRYLRLDGSTAVSERQVHFFLAAQPLVSARYEFLFSGRIWV